MSEGVSTMTNKLNCSTCPHLDESTKRYCTCRKINQQIDGEDMGFVARIGCLSHPGARDYLMRDVIKELEERIDMFSKEAAAKDNYCLSYRAAGLAEAISLIRDGVNHD